MSEAGVREAAVPLPRWEPYGVAAACVLAVSLMAPIGDYLTDDTFIHLQYARHLAGGEGLVFKRPLAAKAPAKRAARKARR